MKKFFVVGNPIKHSLSPKLQNYWIKKYNIDAVYDKKLIEKKDIKTIIEEIKNNNIRGINVTVPFKNIFTTMVDELSFIAKQTQSVNTIYKKGNKIIGDNTDAGGFESALRHINYNTKGKKALILGSGGVVPSIILSLENSGINQITLSNRTREKAEKLKKKFKNIEILDWGNIVDFDIIINATSLGLNKEDKIDLNFGNLKNKLFYDVIYNPPMTNFLLAGQEYGNQLENGKMMFIYQAQLAFNAWHNILPEIDKETIELLEQ